MLAERLKTLREKSGYSQAALAEKCSVGQRSISRWENGESQPRADELSKLVDIFNVTADYLLGRVDLPNLYRHDLEDKNEFVIWEKNEPPSPEIINELRGGLDSGAFTAGTTYTVHPEEFQVFLQKLVENEFSRRAHQRTEP